MKSLATFAATALVLFAFGQAIAARGAEVSQWVDFTVRSADGRG